MFVFEVYFQFFVNAVYISVLDHRQSVPNVETPFLVFGIGLNLKHHPDLKITLNVRSEFQASSESQEMWAMQATHCKPEK